MTRVYILIEKHIVCGTDMKRVSVRARNANQLFRKICRVLVEQGEKRVARGLETVELADAYLVLKDPTKSMVTLPARVGNSDRCRKYLEAEFGWYLSGDLSVMEISKHARFWRTLADGEGKVNSNYGFLALYEQVEGISQLEWCIRRLREDPQTRQAVINYNQPRHKQEGTKDFVCALSQQFIVRNGRLDSVVMMRACDLIWGLTYDMPWFTYLQERVSSETSIPLGEYIHVATSLHVYSRHYGMMRKIAGVGE